MTEPLPALPYTPAEHGPVLWAPQLIGCSCGWRPKQPTPRFDNKYAGYKSHVKRMTRERNDWAKRPLVFAPGVERQG